MKADASRTEQLRAAQARLQRLWDDAETSERIFGADHKRTRRLWLQVQRLEAKEAELLRTGEMMEKRKPYTYQRRT